MTARAIVERVTFERTRADGPVEHQEVTYSEPWLAPGGEWRCAVGLSFKRKKPYEICGVDAAQAKDLAREFAALLMEPQGWRRK